MDSVGVGLVGAGYWGPNLARNIGASPLTCLAWVVDLDRSAADEVLRQVPLGTARATDNIDEMLDDPTVEAVVIATPAETHRELAMKAIESGRHVLVEKPLATSLADAKAIVDAAEDRQVVLMLDHTFCYTSAIQMIRDLVNDDQLGTIQYIDSTRINLGLIRSDLDVFWDLAPHDISIFDFLLPEGLSMVSVSAQAADPVGVGQACIGYFTIRLSNGALAHAHVNWLSPTKIRRVIIGGAKKMVVWDDLQLGQEVSVYDKSIDIEEDAAGQRRALVSYRIGEMVAPALESREALRSVVDDFAFSIREGRRPKADGASGLRVVAVLEGIGRSISRGGGSVDLEIS
ncbi:Gfo/Idh/MocA family oxidoreductase [bacterium]|nr:Gfo/Idh/MocA family oxidoreductase [bacterium]